MLFSLTGVQTMLAFYLFMLASAIILGFVKGKSINWKGGYLEKNQ
jgi:hypothetical protein